MPSNHLILCHPLLLPSMFPSIRFFSNESALCIRWPKYWSFSFNFSPSNEYLGLISFRMDWLDLLAVQGTLKCFLQQHTSKASIFWCSVFFIVYVSHPHMTTGKSTCNNHFKKSNYCGSTGKESACNAEDLSLIPGLGRSPGEGKGYLLQYSCLENSMDCIVHGVAKSWTQRSDFHFHTSHIH